MVPGFGMILKGPIFFKTSDLNSIVSYDLGISLSQCVSKVYDLKLVVTKVQILSGLFLLRVFCFFSLKQDEFSFRIIIAFRSSDSEFPRKNLWKYFRILKQKDNRKVHEN